MDNPSSNQSEEGRVQALDDRFGKIEAEQERQGGLLEEIASKLKGDGGTPGPGFPAVPPSDPGDMAEQMRQAVRDVKAEEAAAEHDAQHAADHDRLRRPAPEQTPREVMVKGKARLQKALFGGDR